MDKLKGKQDAINFESYYELMPSDPKKMSVVRYRNLSRTYHALRYWAVRVLVESVAMVLRMQAKRNRKRGSPAPSAFDEEYFNPKGGA